MCEFIADIRRLVVWTDDILCVVHGAGLTPEDLDKPQVHKEAVTVLPLLADHPR